MVRKLEDSSSVSTEKLSGASLSKFYSVIGWPVQQAVFTLAEIDSEIHEPLKAMPVASPIA